MTSGIVNLDFPLEFCLGDPRQRPRGRHQSDEDEDPDSGSKREDPDSGSKRRGTSVGKKDAMKKKKKKKKKKKTSVRANLSDTNIFQKNSIRQHISLISDKNSEEQQHKKTKF